MSEIRQLPLAKAMEMSTKIVERLAPFCDQIAVAGSIRRQRPVVGDIDLVVMPRAGHEDRFRARCLENPKRVVVDGEQTITVVLKNNVQVDIWIATQPGKDLFEPRPSNFGSLLLMRTGSRAHNIYLVQRAKDLGHTWNPNWGVFDYTGRNCIASESEEEIFKALKLDFVPPEKRER